MICVTGAGGTVGSELVRQLTDSKVAFRAAHFSEAKAKAAPVALAASRTNVILSLPMAFAMVTANLG